MRITGLKITHYRSHSYFDWSPNPVLNCIVGANGVGKTNLLDSIYQLCLGKSHLTSFEQEIIQFGTEFYRIQADILFDAEPFSVVIKQQLGKRKTIEHNGSPVRALSAHVGKLPIILIAPHDSELVNEVSAERRRFLDTALCQMSTLYLKQLQTYNKILEQRNAVLKSQGHLSDIEALVHVYDSQMYEPARFICKARSEFARQVAAELSPIYRSLTDGREVVSLKYKSDFEDQTDWLSFQQQALPKDLALQRTTTGIHRDDILFFMNDRPLKRFSSQGQLKSFIIALKLAQYRALGVSKKPILLLDDIFDKLDTNRISNLLDYLMHHDFGQIFMTDTDVSRAEWISRKLQLTIGQVNINDSGKPAVVS